VGRQIPLIKIFRLGGKKKLSNQKLKKTQFFAKIIHKLDLFSVSSNNMKDRRPQN
jgi:hypothetical protein